MTQEGTRIIYGFGSKFCLNLLQKITECEEYELLLHKCALHGIELRTAVSIHGFATTEGRRIRTRVQIHGHINGVFSYKWKGEGSVELLELYSELDAVIEKYIATLPKHPLL